MAAIVKIFFLILLLVNNISCAPTSETRIEKRSISTDYDNNRNMIPGQNSKTQYRYHGTNKKDVFMSRGWGAGGMPFSVLYMGPTSSKAPMEQMYRPPLPQMSPKPKAKQRVRTTNKVNQLRNPIIGNLRRKGYPIIPQLFVSYGWGPAGK